MLLLPCEAASLYLRVYARAPQKSRWIRSLNLRRFRVRPRRAVWPAEKFIRFFVANNLPFLCVPCQRAAHLHRDVRQNARDRRSRALFDVRDGFAALLD